MSVYTLTCSIGIFRQIMISFLTIFWGILTAIYLLSCVFTCLPFSPFFHFLLRSVVPCYSPLCCSSTITPRIVVPFNFLVSAVTVGPILTYEELELGTSDEREQETLVFMSHSINFSSSIHLPGQILEKDVQDLTGWKGSREIF